VSYEVQREQAHYMLNSARRDEVKIRATLLLEVLDEVEVWKIVAAKCAAAVAIPNGWSKQEAIKFVEDVCAETRVSLAE
jgi:hypothetical protein